MVVPCSVVLNGVGGAQIANDTTEQTTKRGNNHCGRAYRRSGVGYNAALDARFLYQILGIAQ